MKHNSLNAPPDKPFWKGSSTKTKAADGIGTVSASEWLLSEGSVPISFSNSMSF